MELWDIEILIFTGWFIVDFISNIIQIWLELRHSEWNVKAVAKEDVDAITALLENDYEYVTEADGKKVFRREW